MIRKLLAPRDRAARTKSRSLRLRVVPRTNLAERVDERQLGALVVGGLAVARLLVLGREHAEEEVRDVAAAPLADCATLLGGGGGVAPISTPWLPPSFHQSSPPEPARPRQPRPRQALADSNYRGGARRLSDDGRRAQPGEQIVCRRCAAAGAGSRPRTLCARPSDARPTPSCARRMSSWQLRG